MPKFKAGEPQAQHARYLLGVVHGQGHLRTRHRADIVTIESGSTDDAVPHARLKRVSVHLWILEIADHRGKWEATPVRTTLEAAISTLVEEFGWLLTPIEDDENDPLRTSDRQH